MCFRNHKKEVRSRISKCEEAAVESYPIFHLLDVVASGYIGSGDCNGLFTLCLLIKDDS